MRQVFLADICHSLFAQVSKIVLGASHKREANFAAIVF